MQKLDSLGRMGHVSEGDDSGVMHHLLEDYDVISGLYDLPVAVVSGIQIGCAISDATVVLAQSRIRVKSFKSLADGSRVIPQLSHPLT